MKCIVPLAGPDLEHPEHRFRPWYPYRGERILQHALEGRSWRGKLDGSDFVFVVRHVAGVADLEAWLAATWPGCRIVRLSHATGGALFSAMAGIAAIADTDEPVIIDLADILFDCGNEDLTALIAGDVGAVVPCFSSDEPCYSYLRMEDGNVVEAAEKRVISDRASAGVYIFRNPATYLSCARHSIEHRQTLAYRNILFVCPAVNGVIAEGGIVLAPMVEDVQPIGKIFHG